MMQPSGNQGNSSNHGSNNHLSLPPSMTLSNPNPNKPMRWVHLIQLRDERNSGVCAWLFCRHKRTSGSQLAPMAVQKVSRMPSITGSEQLRKMKASLVRIRMVKAWRTMACSATAAPAHTRLQRRMALGECCAYRSHLPQLHGTHHASQAWSEVVQL